MKRLALSAILMLSAAAPALASPPAKPEPKPAPVSALPLDAPLELVLEDEALVHDRNAMLLRCIGPPAPKFPKEIAKTQPMSEPAVISNAPG